MQRIQNVKIRIMDTLSKKKITLKNREIKAYFCGPTVYDLPHLGHARAYIVFDVLVRLLKYLGYTVKYVRNITDIDDKIIDRANREGISPFEIADRYYREFYEAMKALKVLPPNIEPRATAHIPEIIEFIEKLIEKGYAYVASDGVYFRVRKFRDYGKLSKRSIDTLLEGARIEPSPYKEDPLDFALWKLAKPNEPSWQSAWGRGRPGWHIECSTMVFKHLGETIDIHGGGEDLIFPHHENEIAQSEALSGKEFARIWFHVGLLIVGKDKMAKSLKNFVTIKEALSKFDPETIRFYLMGIHYRKQLEFSWDGLIEAEKNIDYLYKALLLAEHLVREENKSISKKPEDAKSEEVGYIESLKEKFIVALSDDLNTPEAIRILQKLAKFVFQKNNEGKLTKDLAEKVSTTMRELGSILGIMEYSLEQRIQEKKSRRKNIDSFVPPNYLSDNTSLSKKLIELIINIRKELRKVKMYNIADRIRSELSKLGIKLEDIGEETRFYIE